MSFADKIPETAHDRLGFLVEQGEKPERLKLFAPHPLVGELERMFRCTKCGTDIAVGPCFEHIDPKTYVGVVCGCLSVETLPDPDQADGGAGQAGTSQEGHRG